MVLKTQVYICPKKQKDKECRKEGSSYSYICSVILIWTPHFNSVVSYTRSFGCVQYNFCFDFIFISSSWLLDHSEKTRRPRQFAHFQRCLLLCLWFLEISHASSFSLYQLFSHSIHYVFRGICFTNV